MVQLTEVPDEHFETPQSGPENEDEDFTDTDSEISTDSNYDPSAETLAERLSALRDIVPPSTRAWVWSRAAAARRLAVSAVSLGGRVAWHLTTSALLVGVPFALAYAEDQQLIGMEQEQRMREMGQEMLTTGGGGSTAEEVGAALGGGGGAGGARPAL